MTSTSADLFEAIEQGDTSRVRTILAAERDAWRGRGIAKGSRR